MLANAEDHPNKYTTMSVKYDVYKSPPRDGEEQDMYHVRIKHTGTVTTDQLAERIEHDTSLTAGDVRNVLASLSHYFVACLSAGERIHLEGVGYFSLAAEAPAVASPREMRAEHVRVRGIHYQPDKPLVRELRTATEFERARYKSHSEPLTDGEVRARLRAYLADHAYLRRADFEQLCGFTRTTAIRRLNALLAEGFLRHEGGRRASIYLLAQQQPPTP